MCRPPQLTRLVPKLQLGHEKKLQLGNESRNRLTDPALHSCYAPSTFVTNTVSVAEMPP